MCANFFEIELVLGRKNYTRSFARVPPHEFPPGREKYKETRLTLMRLIFAITMAIKCVHFVWVWFLLLDVCLDFYSLPNGNSRRV